MGNRRWAIALLAILSATSTSVGAHGDEDHGDRKPATATPAASTVDSVVQEGPQRLTDASLWVPKLVQRQLGVRTVLVHSAPLNAGMELGGTVIADPQSSGRVQAPFVGSVQPGPKGMPVAGRKVTKGEVLAYLQPVASAMDVGNQKAQLAELDAQLAILERRVTRYEQLEGAIAQKDIDAARIERDGARQRRGLVAASIEQAVALRAPLSGVVSSSHHLQAGQMVDARELLFEIVDPTRLAVEALAYDPAATHELQSASALAGARTYALAFVGSGRQLRAQALPLLFRVREPDASLAVGQSVKVVVHTRQGVTGMAVPRSALTQLPSGETAVWIHTEPERFVPRRVRTQALDAAHVVVVEGLRNGERVVTEGGNLLTQVR